MPPVDRQPDPKRLTPKELQERAVHGAAWTLIHTALSIPLAFGVNIVLARTLGASDYGRLAFLTAILEITVLIAGAGVSEALLQFGSRAHAAGRHEDVRNLLRRTQGFRLLVVAPAVTSIILIFADVPTYLLVSAILFGVWLPGFTSGAAVCMALENRTATGAKVAIGLNLLTQAAVLTTVLLTPSPDAVWNARMIVGGLGPLLSLTLISPIYRGSVIRPRLPRMPPGFWRFAIPIGLSGIIANLVLSRSEIFILKALSTPVEMGLYAMSFGLATHILAPAQAFINPLTPAVSSLRETEPLKIPAALLRTTRLASFTAGAICAVGASTVACLVPILYGEEYAPADWIVLILTIVASVVLITSPLVPFVTSRLRGGRILMINAASLAVGIAALIPMIPLWGAWGAVAGKIVMATTRYALFLILEKESFEVERRAILRASVPVALGALIGIGSFWSSSALVSTPVLQTLACLTTAPTLYLLVLYATQSGINQGDATAITARFASQGPLGIALGRLVRLVTTAD